MSITASLGSPPQSTVIWTVNLGWLTYEEVLVVVNGTITHHAFHRTGIVTFTTTGLAAGTLHSAVATARSHDEWINFGSTSIATNAHGLLPQSAPFAPTALSITQSSVVLSSNAGTRIICNSVDLPTGSTWTGLLANTQYSAVAYFPETTTHSRSPNSTATNFTTLSAGLTAPASISYPTSVAKGSPISITWSAVTNATSYTLFLETDLQLTPQQVGVHASTSASHTFASNAPETNYRFSVVARAAGWADSPATFGSWGTLQATPQLLPPLSVTYPTTTHRGSSVLVQWSSVTNAQQYIVERFNNIEGWSAGTTTASLSATLAVTSLQSATQYAFRVVARASGFLDSIATTGATGTLTNPTVATPSHITYPTHRARGSTISIEWGFVTGAVDYLLERRIFTSGVWGLWQEIGIVVQTVTSNVLSSGANDTAYQFRVSARHPNWNNSAPRVGAEGSYSRPPTFAWHTGKIVGGAIHITAVEWNAFHSNINAMRGFRGLGTWSFPSVPTDSLLSASLYNGARSAILDMSPPTAPPAAVVGTSQVPNPADATIIQAAHLNDIVTSLNSIP